MYIWLFSRSVGAGSATTRNTRGLTRSLIALMVPPLPAPSRPSNTTQTLRPLCFTHSCSRTSSPCSRSSSFSYSLRFIGSASGFIALHRSRDVEEHALLPEPLAQLRPAHHRQHLGVAARQPQLDPLAAQALFGFGQHLERRVLDVEHGPAVEQHDRGLRLLDDRSYRVGDGRRVGEKQASHRTQDEQAGPGLVVGILGRARAEHVGAALAADHVYLRVVGLLREREQRS